VVSVGFPVSDALLNACLIESCTEAGVNGKVDVNGDFMLVSCGVNTTGVELEVLGADGYL